MFDELKTWWKNQKQLSSAKSNALNTEKLKHIKEEAKIDNAIRLQQKRNRLAKLKIQPTQAQTLSLFGNQPTATTKKSTSRGPNPSGSILDLKI